MNTDTQPRSARMDFYTVHSKIASQELFTVEEVMFAIRMMESQIEYWVATKIRAQRTGEDDTSIQETLDTLASNLNISEPHSSP